MNLLKRSKVFIIIWYLLVIPIFYYYIVGLGLGLGLYNLDFTDKLILSIINLIYLPAFVLSLPFELLNQKTITPIIGIPFALLTPLISAIFWYWVYSKLKHLKTKRRKK